jgi:hypothetical protein
MGGEVDMNDIDTLYDLKDLHKEFLDSKYFSALSIMTPKEDWLCVHRYESCLKENYEEAQKRKIFNLVVMDGQHVSGYINVKYIKKRDGEYNIDWDKMEKIEVHTVHETLDLFNLLKKMVNDAKKVRRRMSPIYFVNSSQGGSKEPIGIISFWDLNRAPAYILSYPILVYVEHTLIIKIKNSHKRWVEHEDLLTKIREKYGEKTRKSRLFKEFLGSSEYNYSKLFKFGFPELLYFYENDPHIDRDEDRTIENLISLFKDNRKFRNIIAHSVNLIVEGQHFRQNLEDLEKIWDYGKTAFCNFINPKLSYSPPLINEK